VGLDHFWLLVLRGFLLGLAELLDQTHGLALESTLELATGTAMNEFHELFVGEIEQLFEIDTAVGELAEGPLLFEIFVCLTT
jgi:hypothetical protein